MIQVYVADGAQIRAAPATAADLPAAALWLDLRDPTSAEEEAVEALIGAEIPTHEEMREIEASSRLYSQDGADYMTVILSYDAVDGRKAFAPVTFILTSDRLVTLRYSDPKSFHLFAAKLCRAPNGSCDLSTSLRLIVNGLRASRRPRIAGRRAPERS